VVEVAADGTVEEVWTGLTMVVGWRPPRLAPSTPWRCRPATRPNAPSSAQLRRVVKRTGADSLVEVASGLNFPIALALGPDGALYRLRPLAGLDRAGWLRPPDRPDGGVPLLAAGHLRLRPLRRFQAAVAALAAPEATEVAEEDVPTPTPPPVAAGAVPVTIRNFAFDPPTVQIRTGQAVEWTNEDPVAHTATADDKTFDSGNLNTDQSFGYVFDTPGTFPYICIYHPYMKGTIEVSGEAVAGGAEPTEAPAETAEPEAPQATPVGSTGVTVVASGLAAPRGMAWDRRRHPLRRPGRHRRHGHLDRAGRPTSSGSTAAARPAVATGLPSTFDPYKDVMGPQDIAALDGKLYVVQASTGRWRRWTRRRRTASTRSVRTAS
jgi:plastocyanin